MDSTHTCRDLTIGALTSGESQAVATCESFLQAVVQTLRDRGHHVIVATVETRDGAYTAVACDSTDGYAIRTYGRFSGNDESWHEEPVHISRHNAVEKFLRFLRHATHKPLLDHLDPDVAYRSLFADEYRATCAAAIDGWWENRMSEGHTPESAQMLLALALPTHLQGLLPYDRDASTLTCVVS